MGGKNFIGQLGDGTFAQHPDFVLAINPAANGFLNLMSDSNVAAPPDFNVPFFVSAAGGIRQSQASVSTRTHFNASDIGKAGAVFITARVPAGTFGTQPAAGTIYQARHDPQPLDDSSAFVLIQLTASGWQRVINGQLIPFVSGVLGDSMAAQTILNNMDTSQITGAEFCLGYGSNAAEMIAAGRMKTVVTIPDPSNQKVARVSCIVDAGNEIIVYVLEFYNSILDNYFITADPAEAAAIDGGSAGPGWSRTGNRFRSGGGIPVCRFYGSQSPGPNSHFYTADPDECGSLRQIQANTQATQKRWNFESLDFFSARPSQGSCPSGTVPVFRAYNNGFVRGVDSNHRITSSATALQEVLIRGWNNEGVVMCAPG